MATDAADPNFEVTQPRGGPGKQGVKRCFQGRPKETAAEPQSWPQLEMLDL